MNKNAILILAALGVVAMLTITRINWRIPQRGLPYADLFQRAEYQYGIPQFLLAKQAEQESNFNPKAVSHAGAQGIMQIIPRWHPEAGDPFDPAQAIPYAARFMRELYDRFGSWKKALAAYNAGPTRLANELREHGANWLENMPRETRDYVERITGDVPVG